MVFENRVLPKYDHTTVSIRAVHTKSLSGVQPLQEALRGHRFRLDKDIEVFLLEGTEWVLHRWVARFSTHGNYF
jgi:hypothetical protein